MSELGLPSFQIATGSVIGRDHVLRGANNQDAVAFRSSPTVSAVVLCDGCGSMARSEVGAYLGAEYVAASIVRHFAGPLPPAASSSPGVWWTHHLNQIARAWCRRVADWSELLEVSPGPSLAAIPETAFLATFLGAVVTPDRTIIFGRGDGLYALNGLLFPLGPFPNNAPNYLAYDALSCRAGSFHVHANLATPDLDSVLLATDGVRDWARFSTQPVAGFSHPVGPLSQFWTEDRFFQNPDALRRRLVQINRRESAIGGYLGDDVSIAVVRRATGDFVVPISATPLSEEAG